MLMHEDAVNAKSRQLSSASRCMLPCARGSAITSKYSALEMVIMLAAACACQELQEWLHELGMTCKLKEKGVG